MSSSLESVAKEGLSVRELEQRVRDLNAEATPYAQPAKQTRPPSAPKADPVLRAIEDDLRRYLQTDVRVSAAG